MFKSAEKVEGVAVVADQQLTTIWFILIHISWTWNFIVCVFLIYRCTHPHQKKHVRTPAKTTTNVNDVMD